MLWTDDQVDEVVTAAYIHSHLRANEQDILKRPLSFGGDLTNENYLDWILKRAKRFFLILLATGVPDQIFGIIDDSFDDDDLPVPENAVPELRLSLEPDSALDRKFFKTQFRYLTRVLKEGEHIRYAEEETVPITPLGIKSVISFYKDGVDTVHLASYSPKVFVRRRINLDSTTTEESVLAEVAAMKPYSTDHVVSVFATCLQANTLTILFSPAPEWTLKSFLMDIPKVFAALPKAQRRQILMNWTHCLANAVSWLHSNDEHHGAIRPSNIHIDSDYRICLGPLEGDGILAMNSRSDDIESYQYGPPERWKRAVTVQNTSVRNSVLHHGGRSSRGISNSSHDPVDSSMRQRSGHALGIASSEGANMYAFLAVSKSQKYTRFRLSLAADANQSSMSPSDRSNTSGSDSFVSVSRSNTRATTDRSILYSRSPSAFSLNTSDTRIWTRKPEGIFLAAPENRAAVVQTWRNTQHDPMAADVFSLGAVILDILTVLCKRTFSAFSRHRAAKNRNAGRGGGLADASFHANLGQVVAWAEQISREAEKKVSKKNPDTKVLRAVGPVIQVIVPCFDRQPEERPKSSMVEQKLGEYTEKFAEVELHCTSQMPEARTPIARDPEEQIHDEFPHSQVPIRVKMADRPAPAGRQAMLEEEDENLDRESSAPSVSTRRTTAPSMVKVRSPPSVSLKSFPSLTFDAGGASSIVVTGRDSSSQHGSTSWYEPSSGDLPTHDRAKPIKAAGDGHSLDTVGETREYSSGKDNSVDSPSGQKADQASFAFVPNSTLSKEIDEEGIIYHYPLPPLRPPPKRTLPPTPPSSHASSERTTSTSRRR
ncbi:hypothetical protein DV736_g6136, partial [Chaetothyriales sp. CBS 134916]